MRIGEVAGRLGVPTHVLRHWEDVGVVVPDRSLAGHRDYTEDHYDRLRIVLACQSVGLSLAEIRQVLHRGEAGRRAVIDQRLIALREQRARIDDAEAFLTHVKTCRHSLVVRCAECSGYATGR